MNARKLRDSPKRVARIVGVLYLVMFLLGPFAFFLGRTSVVVPGERDAHHGERLHQRRRKRPAS